MSNGAYVRAYDMPSRLYVAVSLTGRSASSERSASSSVAAPSARARVRARSVACTACECWAKEELTMASESPTIVTTTRIAGTIANPVCIRRDFMTRLLSSVPEEDLAHEGHPPAAPVEARRLLVERPGPRDEVDHDALPAPRERQRRDVAGQHRGHAALLAQDTRPVEPERHRVAVQAVPEAQVRGQRFRGGAVLEAPVAVDPAVAVRVLRLEVVEIGVAVAILRAQAREAQLEHDALHDPVRTRGALHAVGRPHVHPLAREGEREDGAARDGA